MRSITALALTATVVVAACGLGDPGAPSSSTAVANPSPEEAQLLAGVRLDLTNTCTPLRTDQPSGALATIECRPTSELASRVAISLFNTQADMMGSYMAGALGAPGRAENEQRSLSPLVEPSEGRLHARRRRSRPHAGPRPPASSMRTATRITSRRCRPLSSSAWTGRTPSPSSGSPGSVIRTRPAARPCGAARDRRARRSSPARSTGRCGHAPGPWPGAGRRRAPRGGPARQSGATGRRARSRPARTTASRGRVGYAMAPGIATPTGTSRISRLTASSGPTRIRVATPSRHGSGGDRDQARDEGGPDEDDHARTRAPDDVRTEQEDGQGGSEGRQVHDRDEDAQGRGPRRPRGESPDGRQLQADAEDPCEHHHRITEQLVAGDAEDPQPGDRQERRRGDGAHRRNRWFRRSPRPRDRQDGQEPQVADEDEPESGDIAGPVRSTRSSRG